MGSKTFLCFWRLIGPTLQETNISPKNGILSRWFSELPVWWDMLIPWRVIFSSFCWRLSRYIFPSASHRKPWLVSYQDVLGDIAVKVKPNLESCLALPTKKKLVCFFVVFLYLNFLGGFELKTNSGRNIKTNLDKKNDLMSVARDPGSLKLRMVEHGS